jgi:hypothetical protein
LNVKDVPAFRQGYRRYDAPVRQSGFPRSGEYPVFPVFGAFRYYGGIRVQLYLNLFHPKAAAGYAQKFGVPPKYGSFAGEDYPHFRESCPGVYDNIVSSIHGDITGGVFGFQ